MRTGAGWLTVEKEWVRQLRTYRLSEYQDSPSVSLKKITKYVQK